MVTSFENMMVSPLDDCFRCVLAIGKFTRRQRIREKPG
jgi:hypothetical protein